MERKPKKTTDTEETKNPVERKRNDDDITANAPGNRFTTDLSKPWSLGSETRTEYFIPTVLCFVIKTIENLDLTNKSVHFSYTLIIRCNLKDLPNEEAKEFVQNHIVMRLDEQPIDLTSMQIRRKSGEDLLFGSYRGEATVFFNPNLEHFPFDNPVLNIKFEMTSVEHNAAKANYRYNCLIRREIVGPMISFKDDFNRIPEFKVSLGKTNMKVGTEYKKDSKGNCLYVYYPFVVLQFQLYREPERLLCSTSIPLLLLNLFSLAVFVLGASVFAEKIVVLSILLLAIFVFRGSMNLPYTTSLDKQLFVSCVVLFFSLLEFVVLGLFGEGDISFLLKKVLLSFAALVTFVTISEVFLDWFKYRKEINIYKELDRKYAEDKKIKMQ